VDAHLPPIPRCRAFARRRLQNWDTQTLRWQRHWSVDFHSGLLGDAFELVTYLFKLAVVGACEADSCFPYHVLPINPEFVFLRVHLKDLSQTLKPFCKRFVFV